MTDAAMKSDEFMAVLGKTREYLDYLERHYEAVRRAWRRIQETCRDMRFVYDDYVWYTIDGDVADHDLSKLAEEEFVAYRRWFFPTAREEAWRETVAGKAALQGEFARAWDAHLAHNPHHWQAWVDAKHGNPNWWEVQCVHMVVDWMAMGEVHGNTARAYYAANRADIRLPAWADRFVKEIFDRVYGSADPAEEVRSDED